MANRDPLKQFLKKGYLEPPIRRSIVDANSGLPYDLTGASAVFWMELIGGALKISGAAAVIESPASSGVIRYDWGSGDTDTSGEYYAEFVITLASGKELTFPPGEFEPGKSYITVKITNRISD